MATETSLPKAVSIERIGFSGPQIKCSISIDHGIGDRVFTAQFHPMIHIFLTAKRPAGIAADDFREWGKDVIARLRDVIGQLEAIIEEGRCAASGRSLSLEFTPDQWRHVSRAYLECYATTGITGEAQAFARICRDWLTRFGRRGSGAANDHQANAEAYAAIKADCNGMEGDDFSQAMLPLFLLMANHGIVGLEITRDGHKARVNIVSKTKP